MSKYSQAAQMISTLTVERDTARDALGFARQRIAELERQLQERCEDLRELLGELEKRDE